MCKAGAEQWHGQVKEVRKILKYSSLAVQNPKKKLALRFGW